MRLCPFKGCVEEIPGHVFSCRRHWNSLKPIERAKLDSYYEEYLVGVITATELRQRQQEIIGSKGTVKP